MPLVVGTNKGVKPALGEWVECIGFWLWNNPHHHHHHRHHTQPLHPSHTTTTTTTTPNPPTHPPPNTHTDSLTASGAKLLKDASSEGGQDVGAVADADGYAVTLVDVEQFNEQLA